MDALKLVAAAPKMRGRRLSDWLERFLVVEPEALAQWQGTFTEVTTAKVVEILRKRGVTEAVEMTDKARFDHLVNLAYRLPDPPAKPEPETTTSGPSTTGVVDGPENPLAGHELRFESDAYEEKNRAFFDRLTMAGADTEIKYFAADDGVSHYDVLGIAGEDRLEAIPAPLFARIVGLSEEENLVENIGNFLRPYFSMTEHARSEWEGNETI